VTATAPRAEANPAAAATPAASLGEAGPGEAGQGEAGQREAGLPGAGRSVLIVVENLPVPFDRRVWLEATTLVQAGYTVSVISPMGRGFDASCEVIDGVHVYRHPLPVEGNGLLGYLREWGGALWHETRLSHRVRRERGIDVLHGCNPPDLIFLVAWALRPWGVSYLFDHHDVSPELFEAKFGKRGPLWGMMRLFEWLTFRTAAVSIATNDSFAAIARERGGMAPEDVFVVRSAPRVEKFTPGPGDPVHRRGARHLVGYVGVIGQQEGLDLLVAAADHLVRGTGRDVHFAVVGFGPHLPDIEADVAARGLGAHFTFTGPKYGDELLAILNTADVCVSPDPKNAMNDISTMNKVVEYMTLGKPVVQFDLCEGRASAGEASLYARANDPVDFAEKIALLLDDPDLRARMGRVGRARVEGGLSWAHSAPRLLAAYERAFAKRAGRRAGRKRAAG
jgi:glycosyltransferase involved in cell wall biosynthesis